MIMKPSNESEGEAQKGKVMKKFVTLSVVVVSLVGTVLAHQPEHSKKQDEQIQAESKKPGEKAAPVKEQLWLKQLMGEWDGQFKIYMQPDKPPVKSAASDSVRALGDHWIVAETKTTMMGAPFSGILSLGYDTHKKKFNATWIDSTSGHLWVYKGTLNDAGDTLTLETEGPSMQGPDKTARYKEVITIKGKDRRTFTSKIELEDGKWKKILEVEYRRKAGNIRAHQERSAPDAQKAIDVHYLEIVTPETGAACDALKKAHGVRFGDPIAEFGNAYTAKLKDGGRIGVRAPMRETETPVVRPYVLVDDIDAAVKAAEAAGAQVAMPPTKIPGQGKFAIYILGGIEYGLWQL